jgi:hypothetical protein
MRLVARELQSGAIYKKIKLKKEINKIMLNNEQMSKIKKDVCVIALKYLEPYWELTQSDIINSGLSVIYVDREGVGSMSKAFNTCIPQLIEKYGDKLPKYLFFVTNIGFNVNTVNRLVESMDKSGFGAIHPSHESDHASHINNGTTEIVETKYIEWTAPIVKTELFLKKKLDENHRYWYFDLIWSYEVKEMGYKIGVDHGTSVNHTYLLKEDKKHIITKLRSELRWHWNPIEEKMLISKYGLNWKKLLWQ